MVERGWCGRIGISIALIALGLAILLSGRALSDDTGPRVEAVEAAASASYYVDPATGNDAASGSEKQPFKTVPKALSLAKGGEVIHLGDGAYPALMVSAKYPAMVTICAAAGAKPVLLGGLEITDSSNLRIDGLRLTWPKDGPAKRAFVSIQKSRQVELLNCEIYDDAERDPWRGFGCEVSSSEHVTLRHCRVHHVYFGVALTKCKDCVADGLDIGPWNHEDGLRPTYCQRLLVENCDIHSAETCSPRATHQRSGHVDGIQITFANDDITIRNNRVHDVIQGITAFTDKKETRHNLRVEGNLVYHNANVYHGMTFYCVDGLTVINNTLPQSRLMVGTVAGSKAVIENNIIGFGELANYGGAEDYNLWMNGKGVRGPHDLVGVDPKMVNAPALVLVTDSRKLAECTEKKLIADDPVKGRIEVGDCVELNRDGLPRKVTAVGDRWLEFDPALPAVPKGGVEIADWRNNTTNSKPDYHLRADSPAVDSGAGDVERGADMEGHRPADVAGVANTGSGKVPSVDRGALEYVPAGK
jgi:hypothetical protein